MLEFDQPLNTSGSHAAASRHSWLDGTYRLEHLKLPELEDVPAPGTVILGCKDDRRPALLRIAESLGRFEGIQAYWYCQCSGHKPAPGGQSEAEAALIGYRLVSRYSSGVS